mgnify:CR=1 FL=1
MNKIEFAEYIAETYNSDPEYPWADHPEYAVFRHGSNRKWFALILDVPQNKLGLPGTKRMDVVNVKCDPILIGSLRAERGIYPAYHMSKDTWITIALDGTVAPDTIKALLDMSFHATAAKVHRK